MFKSIIAAALIASSAIFATAPAAEAYTLSCGKSGTKAAVFSQGPNSPRYFGGAQDIMIHIETGNASYRVNGNWLADKGYYIYQGDDIIIVNPDGSRFTFYGGRKATCRYFF